MRLLASETSAAANQSLASEEADRQPMIVAIGGTTKPGSSTELALKAGVTSIEETGARSLSFDGAFLASLPHYRPGLATRTPEERQFLDAVRRADGMLIASPAYHGGVSALVKNAIDLLEETAKDPRPYLEGLPVGLIVTAHGWQAIGVTLSSFRGIVHALRGWPTPLGVGINVATTQVFRSDGACVDHAIVAQLQLMAQQIVQFSSHRVRSNGKSCL